MRRGAVDTPCPRPREFVYPEDAEGIYTATCRGPKTNNGFYGDGIVNAVNVLRGR